MTPKGNSDVVFDQAGVEWAYAFENRFDDVSSRLAQVGRHGMFYRLAVMGLIGFMKVLPVVIPGGRVSLRPLYFSWTGRGLDSPFPLRTGRPLPGCFESKLIRILGSRCRRPLYFR